MTCKLLFSHIFVCFFILTSHASQGNTITDTVRQHLFVLRSTALAVYCQLIFLPISLEERNTGVEAYANDFFDQFKDSLWQSVQPSLGKKHISQKKFNDFLDTLLVELKNKLCISDEVQSNTIDIAVCSAHHNMVQFPCEVVDYIDEMYDKIVEFLS